MRPAAEEGEEGARWERNPSRWRSRTTPTVISGRLNRRTIL